MADKENKSNSVQLKLSDSELREIDNWRFTNHIPSRNEAIRQLIKQGLGKK